MEIQCYVGTFSAVCWEGNVVPQVERCRLHSTDRWVWRHINKERVLVTGNPSSAKFTSAHRAWLDVRGQTARRKPSPHRRWGEAVTPQWTELRPLCSSPLNLYTKIIYYYFRVKKWVTRSRGYKWSFIELRAQTYIQSRGAPGLTLGDPRDIQGNNS